MASTWKSPENEVNNYIVLDNKGCEGCQIVGSNKWDGPEIIAWRCNQSDDCAGFIFNKNQGYSGWLVKTWNPSCGITSTTDASGNIVSASGGTNNQDRKCFVKKTKSWRKASQPDTSDPSILPTNTATSAMLLFNDFGGNWKKTGGGGFTEITKPGLLSNWGGDTALGSSTGEKFPNDTISSYCIPLGWKYVWDENGNEGWGNSENYGSGGGLGNTAGYCTSMDHPGGCCGMNDRMSGGIIQNIGFDVSAHWNDMENLGVSKDDANKIRTRYCTVSDAIMSTSRCISWFGKPEAGITYNQAKMAVCSDIKLVPDWGKNTGCVNAVNNAIKSSSATDVALAEPMINAYCASNSSSPVCACVNAVTRQISGCTANPSLPGCNNIKQKIDALGKQGAVISGQLKAYCACDDCQKAANSSDGTIIAQIPTECTTGINACFSTVNVGNMSGGNLNAQCSILIPDKPTTGGATGGKGATGGTSGGGGTTGGGGGTTGGGGGTTGGGGGTTGGGGGTTGGGTTGGTSGGGTSKTTYEIICVVIVCLCLILFLIGIFFTMKNSKVS
jgi:hypothetical protein